MPDKRILEKLRATSAVTALCGAATSIRGGTLRQGDTLPGVAAVLASERPQNHATGTTGTLFADVEVWCIAETYQAARGLVDAVETALNGWSSGSISLVHVTDTAYRPGPAIPGQDKEYEVFVANAYVQYS